MDEARTTTLQEQARALGDPTRHAIFRYIADASRAVDIAELTGHFGFNHNAIRQHLAAPDSVCGLHLGIAQGVAARTGDRVIVNDLVRHDPRRANCRLELSVTEP